MVFCQTHARSFHIVFKLTLTNSVALAGHDCGTQPLYSAASFYIKASFRDVKFVLRDDLLQQNTGRLSKMLEL